MTEEQITLLAKSTSREAYDDFQFIIDCRWEKRFEEYVEFYDRYMEIKKMYNPYNAYDVYLFFYYWSMVENFKEYFLNSYMLDNGYFHNSYAGCYEKVVK